MNERNPGLMLGEIDADGIAEYYPKCKIRKEGDIYIATPYTTRFSKRRRRIDKHIAVSVQDGKYMPEKMPKTSVVDDAKIEDLDDEDLLLEEDSDTADILEPKANEPPKTANNVRVTTRRELFDELYAKFCDLKPHEKKKAILHAMQGLFKNEEQAKMFVDKHWKRHRRNNTCRKQRFEYKALNQDFQYFFTITYDSKKHTEESFEKCLKTAFANLTKRYKCLFQGVWERGTEGDRLHFHGIMLDPCRKILSALEEVTEYNPKTGRQRTFLQSPYFYEKFGRNEFREIEPHMYQAAINYITKYISKQGAKPYYSKGLYRFVEADICGEDVLCKMDNTGRDIRLIIASDCNLWKDGECLGKATPETMAHLPKLP